MASGVRNPQIWIAARGHGEAAGCIDHGPDHRIGRLAPGQRGLEIALKRIEPQTGCGGIRGVVDDVVGAAAKRIERGRAPPLLLGQESDGQGEARPRPAEHVGAGGMVGGERAGGHDVPASLVVCSPHQARAASCSWRNRLTTGRAESVS
jgi:hypothetical protein